MASASEVRAGGAFVQFYAKGDAQVRATIAGLQARLQNAAKAVMLIGASITGIGLAITAPFLVGLRHFVEIGSEMRDMADRTGLAVEALSELRYAAEQSGAAGEDLEKGLRAMDEFMVNAARGSPGALQTLELLGITFRELNEASREQRFEIIADALSHLEDATLRAVIAQDIFSRSGARLMPMLRGGADGIRGLRAEARRLGLSLSGEDVAAAEQFGDLLSTLGMVAKITMFHIGAAVAPLLKTLVEFIIRAAGAINVWMSANRELIGMSFSIATSIIGIGAAIVSAGATLWALGQSISVISRAVGGLLKIFMSIGFALTIIKITTGLLGFAGISQAAFILRVGLFLVLRAMALVSLAFHAASFAATVWSYVVSGATIAAGAAVKGFTLALAILQSGFGLLTLAGSAWSAAMVAAIFIYESAAVVISSGFGVITIATILWGKATAIASSIATAAVIVYEAALAGLMTGFGLITIGATTSQFAMDAWVAIVSIGTGVTAAYAAVMAFLTTSHTANGAAGLLDAFIMKYFSATCGLATAAVTALTAGLNLLIGAFVILDAVLLTTIGLIPIAALTYFIYLMLEAGARGLYTASTLSNAFTSAGDSIVSAFRTTANAASTLFAGISQNALTSFRTIRDFVIAGDWDRAWAALVASAELAWHDVKAFGLDTWIAWKFSFLETANFLTDSLTDMFRSAWRSVALMFRQTMWAALSGYLSALHNITRLNPGLAIVLGNNLQDLARQADRNAFTASAGGTQQERADLARDNERRAQERMERNAALTRAREQAEEAAVAGRHEERDRLLNEVKRLETEARIARQTADFAERQRQVNNQLEHVGAAVIQGTFSAAAARGFAGARVGNSEQIARESRDIQRDMRRLLNRIAEGQGLVMG